MAFLSYKSSDGAGALHAPILRQLARLAGDLDLGALADVGAGGAELQLVLAYRQFALDTLTQQRVLQDYRARVEISAADVVPDTRALPLCRDADDQKFLEIAFDTGASSLLTRDKALLRLGRHRLLRERFAILSPEHFINQLPTL